MWVMTVTLELRPDIELSALEQAEEEGLPLAEYVEVVVREAISRREKVKQLAAKSFREILAPIHKGFHESGLTEEEMMEMFAEAREQVYQESKSEMP